MKRLALLLIAALLAGCMHPAITSRARMGPFFTPKNFTGDPRLPDSLQRVLLLPVHGGQAAPPEAAEALDHVFATELQRQMRFEVVTLSRDECQKCFGVPDIGSVDPLPRGVLDDLGKRYGAQAVLWVDITAFQGYRPLVLGIRAKLALVSNHRLVWAFDEVYSASDPGVANGARRYYLANELTEMPVDVTPAALQSPSLFAAYAADTTFRTLPGR